MHRKSRYARLREIILTFRIQCVHVLDKVFAKVDFGKNKQKKQG